MAISARAFLRDRVVDLRIRANLLAETLVVVCATLIGCMQRFGIKLT
jgi:hypothetical protein